jgi:hypothetical protein
MPRYQIRDSTHGLAFYDADSEYDALLAFMNASLRGYAKVFGYEPSAELHGTNGRPPSLTFNGQVFTAVPVS